MYSPQLYNLGKAQITQSLHDLEDVTDVSLITGVSKPPKMPIHFKNEEIFGDSDNVHKHAYTVGARDGKLELTTQGQTHEFDYINYVVAHRDSGQVYVWNSEQPFESSPPGFVFMEKKKNSVRFGLLNSDGHEFTWEDPILFMFLGVKNGEPSPYVVFSAGVGGPHGYGGIMAGNNPDIAMTALASCATFSELLQMSTKNDPADRGDTSSFLKDTDGDYNG